MRNVLCILLCLVLLSAPAHSDTSSEGSGVEVQTGVRPAIIAVIEEPDPSHSEFDLPGHVLEERLELVGVPAGPVLSREAFSMAMVERNTFHRFDSGRILGYFPSDVQNGFEERESAPADHATAVASRVVGVNSGACDTCLVVSVSGLLSRSLAWVAAQTWIDTVTISIHGPIPNNRGITEAVQAITDSGRPVFLSNGNVMGEAEAHRVYSALYNSPAISVGQTWEDGYVALPLEPLGADLATWGYHARIAQMGGGTTTGSGTSYAAPWMAGHYGNLLQKGWQEGWFERVEEDGKVRQRVLVMPENPPWYLEDGHLDGVDVLHWLGTYATYDHGGPPLVGPVRDLEPSATTGYGVLVNSEWARMAAWPEGLEEEPTMGPTHATHQAKRAAVADASVRANKLWCSAGQMLPWKPDCADSDLRDDSWYR